MNDNKKILEALRMQPLSEEAFYVKIDRRRSGKYLRVTRPADALVSLRTVGGDIDKVTLLSPDNIAVKLIDLLISTGKNRASANI